MEKPETKANFMGWGPRSTFTGVHQFRQTSPGRTLGSLTSLTQAHGGHYYHPHIYFLTNSVSNPSHITALSGECRKQRDREKEDQEAVGKTLSRHELLFPSDPYLYQTTELRHNKHNDIPNCNSQQPGRLEYRFHARWSLGKTKFVSKQTTYANPLPQKSIQ